MIETTVPQYRLSSGYNIPALGLGTWQMQGRACEDAVRQALRMGYRHIDTAEMYDNETDVGRALAGTDRDRVFITSKVPPGKVDKKTLIAACQASLKRLQTDYLDLYLVHWPNDDIPIAETLEGMQELVRTGLIRSVGLSNFDLGRLQQALSVSTVPICNLQIEYHPLTHRRELPSFCQAEGIVITAYSPLARGKVFDVPALTELAEKYGKTPAQVSLRWLLQNGHVVIPKASSEAHLRDNLGVLTWELAPADMERIENLPQQTRLVDTQYT